MMKPRFPPFPPFHPRPPSPGCFASNFLPKISSSFSRSLSLKTNTSLVRQWSGGIHRHCKNASLSTQMFQVIGESHPAGSFLAASACGDRTHLGRDGKTRRKPTTDEDGFSGRSPLPRRPSAQCSFPRTVSTPTTTLGGYRVLWGLFMEGQSVLAYVRVRWGRRAGEK